MTTTNEMQMTISERDQIINEKTEQISFMDEKIREYLNDKEYVDEMLKDANSKISNMSEEIQKCKQSIEKSFSTEKMHAELIKNLERCLKECHEENESLKNELEDL